MATYRRNEIVSGLFVVAAVLVFALFAFRVGEVDALGWLRPRAVTCKTHFAEIKTLDKGAKVPVGGQRVVTVRGLRITAMPIDGITAAELGSPALAGKMRQVVEVRFDLQATDLHLDQQHARVSLAQDGFLGRHYLVLDPGTWDPGATPPTAAEAAGGEVLLLRAREVAGLDGLVTAALPVVRRVDRMLATVQAEFLDSDSIGRLRGLLDAVATTVERAGRLLDERAPGGVPQQVLAPLGDLLRNLDRSVGEVRGRLLQQTLPRAEDLLAAGPPLLADTRRLAATMQDILAENRPRLAAIAKELAAAAADLDQRLAALEGELRGTLAAAHGLLADNRGEVAEAVRRLRRTMWQAEMALRKIRQNPAVLLFGDDEPDLQAEIPEYGPLWRSGRARPYGQRDERGSNK